MRHRTKPLFGDQLAGFPADAVRLVLNPDQRVFQMLDVLFLSGGQAGQAFALSGTDPIVEPLIFASGLSAISSSCWR